MSGSQPVGRWDDPDASRQDARAVRGSFIGMGGMAAVAFLIGASVLAAPWWLVALLGVVWLVLLVQGIRWFMTRPRHVAALPVVMTAIWFASVVGGAVLFEWGP